MVEIPKRWRVAPLDNPSFADPKTDDSSWTESDGSPKDGSQESKSPSGVIWYRTKVVVPSPLLREAERRHRSDLVLALGRLHAADETFVNGTLVGHTGSLPPKVGLDGRSRRAYRVPIALLHPDAENLVAIRVYGRRGGRLMGGPFQLRAPEWTDYLHAEIGLGRGDGAFDADKPMNLSLALQNDAPASLTGNLTCTMRTDDFKPIQDFKSRVDIPSGHRKDFSFLAHPPKPWVYRVDFEFQPDGSTETLKQSMNLVYGPEKIELPLTREPNFKEFWDRTRRELEHVKPEFKLTPQTGKFESKTQDVYLIEMKSLGGVTIRGWYCAPKKKGKHPAILETPGLGGEVWPASWEGLDDFAVLSLNIRGHGNSTDDVPAANPA
ncbi:MAG TPA: acetylxylan esterase, partial [Polyangiaceae bacterium]